jgi:hypothetical protein
MRSERLLEPADPNLRNLSGVIATPPVCHFKEVWITDERAVAEDATMHP